MKWTLNEPNYGDIVRVSIGNFYHYGIFVSDDEIIQFGLPPTDLRRDASMVEVCSSNVDTFLEGKFLEVGVPDKKEKKQMLSAEKIVNLAKSRIGEKGYHILYNNCEHFVFQCAFNKNISSQVDEVRQIWRKFPFVNVYVEKFPFNISNEKIYPKEREIEVNECANERVKAEKFYVWKLLEYAIKQSLGIDFKKIKFMKNNSKWVCGDCEFSLSHSGDIVAVVVARNAVGIDVELKDSKRFEKLPQDRILTEEESKKLINEDINKLWTVKEAIFKKNNEKTFNPNKINSLNEKYIVKQICAGDESYYLTIATEDLSFIKFHLGQEIMFK